MVPNEPKKQCKCELIRELRNEPEVISAVERGLEARRNGDRIHWDEVKTEILRNG